MTSVPAVHAVATATRSRRTALRSEGAPTTVVNASFGKLLGRLATYPWSRDELALVTLLLVEQIRLVAPSGAPED